MPKDIFEGRKKVLLNNGEIIIGKVTAFMKNLIPGDSLVSSPQNGYIVVVYDNSPESRHSHNIITKDIASITAE